jgi:hypothetical protein
LGPDLEKKTSKHENICGRYPSYEHVTVDNLYWQVLSHSKGLVSILNAYLDTRQNKSVVRINVISKYVNNSDTFFCQFWFKDSKIPSIAKATDVLLMWGKFVWWLLI